MKLYDAPAPNPLVVRLFIHERGGLAFDAETVDIRNRTNRGLHYRQQVNPRGEVPALVLDDGQVITEITAICEYLDETAKGGQSLFGATPEERAVTRMWTRRVYLEICHPVVSWFRNGADAVDFYRGYRIPVPEAQLVDKIVTHQGLNRLDDELEGKEYICGSRVTMADLMLYGFMSMLLEAAPWLNPPGRTNVSAWFARMSARETTKRATTPFAGHVTV